MKPLEPVPAYRERTAASPADAGDADLVQRMQGGDEQALGLLFDRWEFTVRTVAIGIVGDATEAEDVVEDTFWQAWRQAERFDTNRGSAGSWLVTIARSRALDRRRAMNRVREDAGLDDLETSGADVQSTDMDPLESLEVGERSRRLHAALDTLPTEQRESLHLAYFEGMSQTEIAARTGLALGTVKTRMRLAMQKLRGVLAETGERAT